MHQPLGFFSKKLSPAQIKYSTYDRELLAIYEANKYFKHMLEGRDFIIYTDHKPLIYAFTKKNDLITPRQTRYLEFISQFSCKIQHIKGENNSVADALSRIFTIDSPSILTCEELYDKQSEDEELKAILLGSTSLKLTSITPSNSNKPIYGEMNVSSNSFAPYVPSCLRRKVFKEIHDLSHTGGRATLKLIRQRYIWPKMNKDIKL